MNVLSATGRIAEGRVATRQRKIRQALVDAGYRVISEKGVDAATMQEIADIADVGAGTIYSYFKSKDDLAVAVMEKVMHRLAQRIEEVTNSFTDPAQVYAFGLRTVMEAATGDPRWKRLLNRSEVIADAMFRCMGPFAMRDLENATRAGRFRITNIELTWKIATHAIIGASLAITKGELPPDSIDEIVVRLLCMSGLSVEQAEDLAGRPRPPLPRE
jgi:AcrR family transcriptional regulator